MRVLQPRIYVGIGYIWIANNYGYPNLNGLGFGGEKLPDLNHTFSFFGSVWYYPNVNGNASVSVPNHFPATGFQTRACRSSINMLKYQAGITIALGNSPALRRGRLDGRQLVEQAERPDQPLLQRALRGARIQVCLYP